MNFSLILTIEFPKKKIMEVLRINNLNMTDIFNMLIFYLINTLLLVPIKQTSKNRSLEAAIQMCSLK